ncbi:hypothetical protein QYF36_011070 [Acer negundo]|nr:hypothetical protein QYF36_011070 [Acer negundo]
MQGHPILNKSTWFENMKNAEDDKIPFRRPLVKKLFFRPKNKVASMESRDGDFDDLVTSREHKFGQSSSAQHASRPEYPPGNIYASRPTRSNAVGFCGTSTI